MTTDPDTSGQLGTSGGPDTVQLLIQTLSAKEQVTMLETHISWIVLYGQTALKLKKPISNPFLDYSTLDLRRKACYAELKLNRRYAPDLYQSVVGIYQRVAALLPSDARFHKEIPDSEPQTTQQASRVLSKWVEIVELPAESQPPDLSLDVEASCGPILEYAVKMRRFPSDALLAHRLDHDLVSLAAIEQLACSIARFHTTAQTSRFTDTWGSPETVIQDSLDNLTFLNSCCLLPAQDLVSQLRNWTDQAALELTNVFEARRRQGLIRECHGDLHLENIIQWNGQLIPFDGIEFSEHLRWIDIQNDAAFTSMDLMFHNHQAHANRFTNAYLEYAGDYQGLRVLRWYQVYRALVRAKVTLLRAQQETDPQAVHRDIGRAIEFLQLAERISKPTSPKLMITFGLSGSGKTYGTENLIDNSAAIRIRSDVQRKRQADNPAEQSLYSKSARQAIYRQLLELAEHTLAAGYDTIIDATFLSSANRTLFRMLAQRLNVPFQILEFDADYDTLRNRIIQRQTAGNDPSDADLDVLEQQIETREPLQQDEQPHVIKMNL